MNEQLQRRLEELRAEYKRGGEQLKELDNRRAQITETLLRISGAIQVLEEMLHEQPAGEQT